MKKILILGSTGHLGNVLLKKCIESGFEVNVLVRDKSKLKLINENLKVFEGQVTNQEDLSKAIVGVSAVISVLGHGFRTKYPIQENTMKILIPIMQQNDVKRLVTITGAGLKTKEDPKSLILNFSSKAFSLIDPYRVKDAKAQQNLIENSNLDWTVVRTPVHDENGNITIKHVGYDQPKPWQRISRIAVSNFMIQIIEKDEWIKKSPIIY